MVIINLWSILAIINNLYEIVLAIINNLYGVVSVINISLWSCLSDY